MKLRCSECQVWKPDQDFAPRRDGRGGGRRSRCHACDAAASKARYYASHPAAVPRDLAEPSTTYRAAHQRVARRRGRASEHPCAHGCGRTAAHWAYDHKDPGEITGWSVGRRRALVRFSVDPDHYIALCRSCHGTFDSEEAARRAAARLRGQADDLPTWVRPPDGFALVSGVDR